MLCHDIIKTVKISLSSTNAPNEKFPSIAMHSVKLLLSNERLVGFWDSPWHYGAVPAITDWGDLWYHDIKFVAKVWIDVPKEI